ncbi:MAG: hypothetical protein ABTR92_19775 [Candidatus Accumulibacter phosphatis]
MNTTNLGRMFCLLCGAIGGLLWSVIATADPTTDTRVESCRAKLIQAQKLDVLYDMQWKSPREPRVVVGPTFLKMPIDGKEGFAATVNCFLMAGDTGKCVNFDTLHWQTGKALGRFSNCRFAMH